MLIKVINPLDKCSCYNYWEGLDAYQSDLVIILKLSSLCSCLQSSNNNIPC